MRRYEIPEHPLIERCLRTGYPYPVHDLDTDDDYEEDNDECYYDD